MTNEKSAKSKRRLGRGLSSLVSPPVSVEAPEPKDRSDLIFIDVNMIERNPYQPRQQFDDRALESLADSIRSAGLMQPLVVRKALSGRAYQLIAGERRWRAAKIAGLDRVPAIVRDVDDKEAAEFALIENIQREDLNPIDRAEAFLRLAQDFSMTHQEVATRVGLERSNVTNHLRLLELDHEFKDAVRHRKLSMGHARALLAIPNIQKRREIGLECIAGGWSVREIERRARAAARSSRHKNRDPRNEPNARQLHVDDLQRRLSEQLGTRVEIRLGKAKGSGQLVVSFYSFDEFDGLLQRLNLPTDDR